MLSAGRIFPFVVAVCVACANTASCSAEEETDVLTVQETVGVIFAHEPYYGLINHANPAARDPIRIYAESMPLTLFHESALYVLGVIGTGDDARWIQNRLRQRHLLPGSNDRFETVIIKTSLSALGMMARRGNREAQRILEDMASVQYWRRAGVIWFPDGPFGFWTQEFPVIHDVLSELKSTEIPEEKLASICRLVYEDLEHAKAREKFLVLHGPDWLRLPRQHLEIDRRELTDNEIGFRKSLPRRWNGDLKNPRPSAIVGEVWTPPRIPDALPKPLPAPPEYVEFVSKLALENYAEITKGLRKQKGMDIGRKLAKHGHPLFEGLLKGSGAEQFARFLQMQADLQDTLTERKIKPVFDRIRREAIVQDGRVVEWVEIRHILPGTADIAPKSDQHETFAADGSLVILMRRVDGQWYWQPFGW